jgi:hypothetical protein
MKWLVVASTIAIVACSSETGAPSQTSTARASIQLTLGTDPPIQIDAAVTSNNADSRLLLQAADSNGTVFVSLPLPLAPHTELSENASSGTVWAKQGASVPLIANAGSLSIEQNAGLVDFEFSNVSRAADAMGTSLVLTGSMTGVPQPR